MLFPDFACKNCGSHEIYYTEKGLICDNCQTPFELNLFADENDFTPQRIFLSCAPSDHEFCREIMTALRERGHEVLSDETRVMSGISWRSRIISTVKSCDSVIAALSQQALQGPDSCLDELAVAIASVAGKIQVLLLEPEAGIDIPASLAHRPRLDLTAWRGEKKNPATYGDWFSGRMDELFTALEEPENAGYGAELQDVYEALGRPTMASGRQDGLLGLDFIGREWLTKDIENWLNTPDGSRVCLLTADMGFGKSTWAAHYSHFSRRVAAAFFYDGRRFMYGPKTACLFQIICQLACRLPDYRARLLPQLKFTSELSDLSADDVFEQLIAAPLQDLEDEDRETLLILIDSLDEIIPDGRDTLTRTLLHNACRLPRWLRFLVTLGPESELCDDPNLSSFVYRVDTGHEDHLNDLRSFLRKRLGHFKKQFGATAFDTVVEQIIKAGAGSFLYARLFLDCILSGKAKLQELNSFPIGLDGIYDFWFRTNFPDLERYHGDIRDVLGAIGVSPYPLPLAELERLYHWTDRETGDVTRTAAVLLQYGRDGLGQWTVDFMHPYTSFWLFDRGTETYRVQDRQSRQRLTRELARLYADEGSTGLTGYEIVTLLNLLPGSSEEATKKQVVKDMDLVLNLFMLIAARLDSLMVKLAKRALLSILELMGYDVSKASDPDEFRLLKMSAYRHLAWQCREDGLLELARNLMEFAILLGEELLQGRNSPDDQSEFGATLQVYGRILQALGESEKARSCHLRCLELHERLLETRNSFNDQHRLATSCFNYADFLQLEGEEEAALDYYEKDIALSERLLETRNSFLDLSDLASSYDHYARLLHKLDDSSTAAEFFAKSIALKEQLAATRNSREDQLNLYDSREFYALFLRNWVDEDEAASEYEKNIAFGEALAASRDDSVYRIRLVMSYNNYGCHLHAQGERDEARTCFEKGLALHEELLAADTDAPVPLHLADIYSSYADLLTDLGEVAPARMFRKKHIDFYEREQAERKLSIEDRSTLAESYRDYVYLLDEQGEEEEARKIYEHSITLGQEVVAARGHQTDYLLISELYSEYSQFLLEQGKTADANDVYERGIDFYQQLDREKDSEWRQRSLARIHDKYAALLRREGSLSQACEQLEMSIAGYEKLLQEGSPSSDTTWLAESYHAYGQVLKELGRDKESLLAVGKSTELSRQLSELSDGPVRQREQAVSSLAEASVQWMDGDEDLARGQFELYLPVLERLAERYHGIDDLEALATSYSIYANLLWSSGDASKSRSCHEKHVALREELLEAEENDEALDEMVNAYEQYAFVLRELRYRSQAQQLEKKAKRLRERLEAERSRRTD